MIDLPDNSDPQQAPSPERRRKARGWLHDVRNAANSARMAVHAAEVQLQQGEPDRALVNLARARDACDRLARLTSPRMPAARVRGNGAGDGPSVGGGNTVRGRGLGGPT